MTRLARAVVVAVLGAATPTAAGPMTGIGPALGRDLGRQLGEIVDFGPEVSIVTSIADGGTASAIAFDAVIAAYADDVVELERTIGDRLLGRRVARRWPFLSHQVLAFHVGLVLDLEGGRRQLHTAAGSGLGPVGLALAMEYEDIDGVPKGFAFGPELRLRHRFGPAAHAWSVGALARGELFVNQRDAHPDRVTLGAFVMWGW